MEENRSLTAVLMKKDSDRNKAEIIAWHRDEEFKDSHPGLRELLQKRKDIGTELLKASVFGEDSQNELKRKLTEISEEIREKYGDWEAAPNYTCPKCGDTGYVLGSGKPCQCLIDGIYVDEYGALAVDELEGSFDKFDESVFPSEDGQRERAYNTKKRLIQICSNNKIRFFTLYGPSGTGKSFNLGCMAKEMKKEGRTVIFIDSNTLFELFRMARVNDNEEKPFLAYLYTCDALFIDDLGAEPMTKNVTIEYFFDLLKRRNYTGYFTAFGTNLEFEALNDRYGERSSSRIMNLDCCKAYRISGKDLRRHKK